MSSLKRCDRCGERADVVYGDELPKDWEKVDDLDFCPGCMRDYRAFLRNEEVKPRKRS